MPYYLSRWISRGLARKTRRIREAGGFLFPTNWERHIVIEPEGSNLGDGPILTRGQASYQICRVFCQEDDMDELIDRIRALLGFRHDPTRPQNRRRLIRKKPKVKS